jgi:hypothetical protein
MHHVVNSAIQSELCWSRSSEAPTPLIQRTPYLSALAWIRLRRIVLLLFPAEVVFPSQSKANQSFVDAAAPGFHSHHSQNIDFAELEKAQAVEAAKAARLARGELE